MKIKQQHEKTHGPQASSLQHEGAQGGYSNQAILALLNKTPEAKKALPFDLQSRMQSKLGFDLSSVKITESAAVADIGEGAVARGHKIQFAPGRFDPYSAKGRQEIGHELAHVAQQAQGDMPGGIVKNAGLEHDADMIGTAANASPDTSSVSIGLAPLPQMSGASAQGLFGFGKKPKQKANAAYDAVAQYWSEQGNTTAHNQRIGYTPQLQQQIRTAGKFTDLHRRLPRMLEIFQDDPESCDELIQAFTTGDEAQLKRITTKFVRRVGDTQHPESLDSSSDSKIIENFGDAQRMSSTYADVGDLIKSLDLSGEMSQEEIDHHKERSFYGANIGNAYLGHMKKLMGTKEGRKMQGQKLTEIEAQYGTRTKEKTQNAAQKNAGLTGTTKAFKAFGLFGTAPSFMQRPVPKTQIEAQIVKEIRKSQKK